MKRVKLLAAISVALLLAACGGSNNGSNTGTGGGTTIPAGTHVEALVLHPTTFDDGSSPLSGGQTFEIQDPMTIEAQDQVQFQLVYEDSAGRHILPSTNWVSSDTTATYGALTYNSGVFVASTALTPAPQVMTTFYGGQVFSANYSVLPRQVRLRGVLLGNDTKRGIGGIQISFYAPTNPTLLVSSTNPLQYQGEVTTAYDGTFRASIPASVVLTDPNAPAGAQSQIAFTLVNNTLPSKYQREFEYDGKFYQTGNATGCGALVPTETLGERFLVDSTNSNKATNGTILLLPSSQSAPALTGCTTTN